MSAAITKQHARTASAGPADGRDQLTDTTSDEGEEEGGVARDLGRNLELCRLLDTGHLGDRSWPGGSSHTEKGNAETKDDDVDADNDGGPGASQVSIPCRKGGRRRHGRRERGRGTRGGYVQRKANDGADTAEDGNGTDGQVDDAAIEKKKVSRQRAHWVGWTGRPYKMSESSILGGRGQELDECRGWV